MALNDDIEFYGRAVMDGRMDRDTAAAALAEASGGGITPTGAQALLDEWADTGRQRDWQAPPLQTEWPEHPACDDDTKPLVRCFYSPELPPDLGTVLAAEAITPDGRSQAWRAAVEPGAPADVVTFLLHQLWKKARRECPDAAEYRVYGPRTDSTATADGTHPNTGHAHLVDSDCEPHEWCPACDVADQQQPAVYAGTGAPQDPFIIDPAGLNHPPGQAQLP
jgi:hypothetical protein